MVLNPLSVLQPRFDKLEIEIHLNRFLYKKKHTVYKLIYGSHVVEPDLNYIL